MPHNYTKIAVDIEKLAKPSCLYFSKVKLTFAIILFSGALLLLEFDLSNATVKTRPILTQFRDHPVFKKLTQHYYSQKDYLASIWSPEDDYEELLPESFSDWKYRPRAMCNCSNVKYRRSTFEPGLGEQNLTLINNSTCSPEASELGPNQLIISYSYYVGNRNRDYTRDMREILNITQNFYPGWVLRVYTNIKYIDRFCDSICDYQDLLYFCPIEYMDHFEPGNFSTMYPRQWRYLPLSEPLVPKFISRDLDSRPSQRERDAVTAWEESTFPFHAMRDHQYHGTPILAGMWGADNQRLDHVEPGLSRTLRNQLIFYKSNHKEADQHTLNNYIYKPYVKKKYILIHDSYKCGQYKDSVPFPTKRVIMNEFVGKPLYFNYDKHVAACPPQCRPKNGQDWTYC